MRPAVVARPIVSEAEFLARREAVERVMVIRQRDGPHPDRGVLEDKVLVEHYVARESQTSLIGNVYLGRVQNVLPSMEAAFVDIGKGRNAVLYAGEVNWSALGHPDGQQRKIESVLSSGQQILVQVTKDPIGHKGARLTSQVSLAGRFLVYVPDGTTSGISRKLPDTERNRLKTLLKEIVPDTAGVIVRTAAEGASEDELTRDVERLKARWEDIEKKAKGSAPQLLYGEPDLTLKVVRDLFTEDFTKLVIEGGDAWETVQDYVVHVAPDLEPRLERYRPEEHDGRDVFASYRIDEQIHKGLDRKVWLPSGGSLVIDRTEAMTVVDVNTGKFTGSGRQPRGDRHQEQPRGRRGDGPAAPAPRHRRHHRRRLHRHGAGVQPRPGAAPAGRVPRPRPDAPPGRRGHLARPGADDPQAHRHRPARVVQPRVRPLPRPWPGHRGRARRVAPLRRRRRSPRSPPWRGRGDQPAAQNGPGGQTAPRARRRPRTSPRWPSTTSTPSRGLRPRRPGREDATTVVENTEVEVVVRRTHRTSRKPRNPSTARPRTSRQDEPVEDEPSRRSPRGRARRRGARGRAGAAESRPEPPKVVTRTRRRAASRPAGPPAAVPGPRPGAVLVADQPGTGGANSHDHDESRRCGPARADQEAGLPEALTEGGLTCVLTVLHVVLAGPYY